MSEWRSTFQQIGSVVPPPTMFPRGSMHRVYVQHEQDHAAMAARLDDLARVYVEQHRQLRQDAREAKIAAASCRELAASLRGG